MQDFRRQGEQKAHNAARLPPRLFPHGQYAILYPTTYWEKGRDSMRKTLGRVLGALLLLCALPSLSLASTVTESKGKPKEQAAQPEPAAARALTGMDVRAVDATNARVSWEAEDCPVTIYYTVAGQERYYYWEAEASPATIDLLAPETAYDFIVVDEDTGVELSRTATMPAADPYRVHGYRWNLCNTYVVQDGDAPLTERRRLRSSSVTRAELKENMRGGSYVMILEAWWNKTAEDKEWIDMWVMRTPDGMVYQELRRNSCEADWTALYYFYPLSDMFDAYQEDRGDWALGEYQFEIYFDGEFAGRTKLTLKE